MKKLFRTYKDKFDMSCKVMKAMAEEIVTLREQNKRLRDDNKNLREEILSQRKREDWLEDTIKRQGTTLKAMRDVLITTEEITANK